MKVERNDIDRYRWRNSVGVDFINRIKKPFKKGLDRARVELATPHLFTKEPNHQARSYKASIVEGESISEHDTLNVRLMEKNQVVALKGLNVVAELESPPGDLIEGLRESHGEGCGTVLVVHALASVAEIEVS